MKLYKLYNTESEWLAKHAEVNDFLNLPIGTTTHYAEIAQVENPASDDYEKYLFPVIQNNQWSCIELFDASGLVPWQSDWDIPLE